MRVANGRLYVGEAVRLTARVTDPDTGQPTAAASATVDLWAPEVDRKTAAPTRSGIAMTYRPTQRDYVTYLDTAQGTWPPGRWNYRVTVIGLPTDEGTFRSIEFSTFVLEV